MASRVLVCNANGNLTGASTFALSEAGASATKPIRNTTTTIAAATNVTSSLFTVTAADVIDGVVLWLQAGAGATGTIKVELVLSGVVQGTGCTINKSDLPPSTITGTAPVLFKMAASATGDGTANWGIKITTTGTVTTTIAIASATATDFTRILRLTTAATPAATDDLYILGEWTAAATVTTRTVTMNSTAATAYGSGVLNTTTTAGGVVMVGSSGVLTYGSTASTNYILRINGDLFVMQGGTLNIGTSGTPIPRTSTAVLEFVQNTLNGDFGLNCMDNSTVTSYGLSRTIGKNVVSAKLLADSSVNLVQASTLTATTLTAAAVVTTLDPTGTSLAVGSSAGTFNQLIGSTDTVANANHKYTWTGTVSVTATTQVYTQWIKRGSGTNNRFVRLQLATATTLPAINGFFADFDLQTPSAGTCTALGNGTATSASITAFGGGFICTIIGKISSGASAPTACIGACSASGTVSYAGDATQNFIINWPEVYTLSAQPTQDTIGADTGWLSGDVVALASTTRTPAECEVASLASNAGASTLTYNLYPVNARSGTSPTQADVILLTRNVKIRSTSTTLHSYVYCTGFASVTMQWTEMAYIGANVTNKLGLNIDGVSSGSATAKSITFCSVHDCNTCGLRFNANNGINSLNLTYSNNTMWNLGISVGQAWAIGSTVSLVDWTCDSNVLIKATTGTAVLMTDISGTFTNNTIVGGNASFAGIQFQATAVIGNFTGNTVYCCGSALTLFNPNISGTIDHFTGWRNNAGITLQTTSGQPLYFTTLTLFGNTASNFAFTSQNCDVYIQTATICSDTSFSTTTGITIGNGATVTLFLDNVTTAASGILAAQSNDFAFTGTQTFRAIARNCAFGGTNVLGSNAKLGWSQNSYMASEKYGQTSGDHRCEMPNGLLKTDSVIFHTAAPSMRATPSSASLKLESAVYTQGIKVAVASGTTVNIAAYVRKSVVGDGVAYNGNQPRLIQRANPALGQNSDVVLATYSSAAGSWNQLSATSSSATDDGAWEFIIDCDGTAGWINIDDWSTS